MIASGSPISAAKAAEMGLVDKLVDESHLAAEAIAFARTFDALRRTGDNSVSVDSAVFEAFATENARKIRGLEAPKACIEAVKAATELPIDQGQPKESALFAKLVAGAQSEALRHVFLAERAPAKIAGLPPDIPLRPTGEGGGRKS